MKLKLKPYDVLFFRDGKPQAESGETFSVFPPSPETFYNAFRSGLLTPETYEKSILGSEKDSLLGTAKELGNLELNFLQLCKKDTLLFACPKDLVQSEGKVKKLETVKPSTSVLPFSSDLDFEFTFNKKSEKVEGGGFLTFSDFESYLNGETNNLTLCKTKDLYSKKFRNQNKLTYPQKSTADESGQVFGFDYTQLEDKVCFALELNCDYKEKFLRLGGDGKAVSVEETDLNFLPELKPETLQKINETKRFKLVTATPTAFEKGWKAKWMESGKFEGVEVELLGATVGKYEIFGGWDIQAKKPKTTFRFVPAGSVYFFELKKGAAENLKECFHGKKIAENFENKEFNKLGFGLTFLGGF